MLLLGVLPVLWEWCGVTLLGAFQYDWREHELLHSVAFLSFTLVLQTLLELPWDVYATFVIEQRYKYNLTQLLFSCSI